MNTSRNRLSGSSQQHDMTVFAGRPCINRKGSTRFELPSGCLSAESLLEKKQMRERVQACIERLETELKKC